MSVFDWNNGQPSVFSKDRTEARRKRAREALDKKALETGVRPTALKNGAELSAIIARAKHGVEKQED